MHAYRNSFTPFSLPTAMNDSNLSMIMKQLLASNHIVLIGEPGKESKAWDPVLKQDIDLTIYDPSHARTAQLQALFFLDAIKQWNSLPENASSALSIILLTPLVLYSVFMFCYVSWFMVTSQQVFLKCNHSLVMSSKMFTDLQ